jgi:hypothetical protein
MYNSNHLAYFMSVVNLCLYNQVQTILNPEVGISSLIVLYRLRYDMFLHYRIALYNS